MENIDKQNFKPQGDRLRFFIEEYLGITIRQFSASYGDPKASTIYMLVNGDRDISHKVEETISQYYPQLNFRWVRKGIGDMLNHGYEDKRTSGEMSEDESKPLTRKEIQSRNLGAFIESLGISINKFSQEIGVGSTQVVYNILNRTDYGISYDVCKLIRKKYPRLNEDWLMEGEGDMLMPEVDPVAEPVSIAESDSTCCLAEPVEEFTSGLRPKGGKLYEMSEGTKGIIIPFHLDDEDVLISSLNLEKQDIGSIISKSFSFFYQVQTDQLFPQLCKNDWMLLEAVKDLNTLVDGRVYMFNTVRQKVTCRMFRNRFGILELVDINQEDDVLVLENLGEIREAFEVICALRNNPLIPIHATFYGKEIARRDKEISNKNKQIDATINIAQESIRANAIAIQTQKQAIDEIVRTNRRMEDLYSRVITK